MKDSSRIAVSINIINNFLLGEPIEKVFTNWARKAKYAGSSDRAAIRDIIFCCLRSLKSFSKVGNSFSGRGVVIGYLLVQNEHPVNYFTGTAYAPAKLTDAENENILNVDVQSVIESVFDFPDWMCLELAESLDSKFIQINKFFRNRAPMFLRVTSRKSSIENVRTLLLEEKIETKTVEGSSKALAVCSNIRKVKLTNAFKKGLFEVQDINSQIACEMLHLKSGSRVLDFCAGGGGKSLAIKDKADVDITAYDLNIGRMKDIPVRSERTDTKIRMLTSLDEITGLKFDAVICDVPCSGSGAWRRNPDGKWSLTKEKYELLKKEQHSILKSASQFVREGGLLVYMTCSILKPENEEQVNRFLLENKTWENTLVKNLSISNNGDGFFLAINRKYIS